MERDMARPCALLRVHPLNGGGSESTFLKTEDKHSVEPFVRHYDEATTGVKGIEMGLRVRLFFAMRTWGANQRPPLLNRLQVPVVPDRHHGQRAAFFSKVVRQDKKLFCRVQRQMHRVQATTFLPLQELQCAVVPGH